MATNESEWLTNAEVRKLLKISTCELAHRRMAGEIGFKNKGNTFLYSMPGSTTTGIGDHKKQRRTAK